MAASSLCTFASLFSWQTVVKMKACNLWAKKVKMHPLRDCRTKVSKVACYSLEVVYSRIDRLSPTSTEPFVVLSIHLIHLRCFRSARETFRGILAPYPDEIAYGCLHGLRWIVEIHIYLLRASENG